MKFAWDSKKIGLSRAHKLQAAWNADRQDVQT
jgi:hypothetical protein